MSNDIFFTFLTIEFNSFVFYLLISRYSNALKYFISSSIVTTLLLLAIILIYSKEGNLLFWESSEWAPKLFITLFLIFKLGLFPFHILTGDLYNSLPLGPMI